MLSGESTPLLKESIQLLEKNDNIDVDGAHKNAVLFSGTKILQATPSGMVHFLVPSFRLLNSCQLKYHRPSRRQTEAALVSSLELVLAQLKASLSEP